LGEPNVGGEPESRLDAKSNELEAGGVTTALVDADDAGVTKCHAIPPRRIIAAKIAKPTIILLLCLFVLV
jgi:hypothetical protein